MGGDSVRPKHVKKCMKLNWNFQRGGQPRSQRLSSYRLSLLTPRGGKMRDPGNEVEGWVAGGVVLRKKLTSMGEVWIFSVTTH